MKTILTVVPHFPSASARRDGQAIYLSQVVDAAGKRGDVSLMLIALRVGSQPTHEHGEGWSIQRVDPPKPLKTVYDLYLPQHLKGALGALHAAAIDLAASLGVTTPVWCHGYETGEVIQSLSKRGHHVVAVPHYSVGVETIHDLALGDDAIRSAAFDSPIATKLGAIWPKRARAAGVRWASRLGKIGQSLPFPSPIQTQFSKLALERMLMAHASTIVAVGPSFEAEINRLYPCTTGRSTHVIAGAPRRLPQPQWPSPKAADILRIIMVGRPSGQKGWEYVAEALGQLDPKLGHRIELVIIGGLGQGQGPYSSYSTHMAERFAALAHTPVFNLGELPHDTVLAHLKAADLLLFPSIFEPLGLVLLEAMAAGTCIVASDAAGPVDLVREPWGRLMPFSDPKRRVEEITRGIKHAVNLSKAEREAYKSSARTAARMHTWSACAEVHIEALLAL